MKPRRPGVKSRVGAALAVLALLAGCASPAPERNRTPDPVPDAPPKADAARLSQTRLELAAAYFQRGQNATALQEIKAALQADPNQVPAYGLRGLIYAAMGDAGQAEESFRQGLRLSSRDPDTLHNYGWFLCQERRFAEADQQFALAAQVPAYPDLARTLLAQGICQARAQRWPEAERSLARSYELDPSNPATGFNLADVLFRRGEHERARFYVRRVNQIDDQVTAQSLWLALRIERQLGQAGQVDQLGSLLSSRFPNSPEAGLYERRRFDD
ncbi:type IV pilus biogenesis/stability protein PilW [Ideonella sp. 4Y16]|uniref:Type IV pilus biogenesis/stability protein PilW n=1 Tax=Ideonella alba TaxID=2824118 RepID=A0A940Y905_9BURK|nr:type IV pilus biogenesis/stability protein PilW [Ideonella alba]MBQ0930861.1 type IV pilus biogenesis/stability protein PilW [Ideonella alba]MBQ0942475.1 type IV pilus biogenesis/stability protein PilW [Ideonella alba]